MPSWNIHLAHAERLLERYGCHDLGVRDANVFLLGNLVPDIGIGYMVKHPKAPVRYRESHFADPSYVPEPDYQLFWEKLGRRAYQNKQAPDLVLGTWCHLMADHIYNAENNAFIRSHGIAPGEKTRIHKQADFNLYGKSCHIHGRLQMSDELRRQCREFPQYRLDESDVKRAILVANKIIQENTIHQLAAELPYCMLTADFFETTSKRVDECMAASLLGLHDSKERRETNAQF